MNSNNVHEKESDDDIFMLGNKPIWTALSKRRLKLLICGFIRTSIQKNVSPNDILTIILPYFKKDNNSIRHAMHQCCESMEYSHYNHVNNNVDEEKTFTNFDYQRQIGDYKLGPTIGMRLRDCYSVDKTSHGKVKLGLHVESQIKVAIKIVFSSNTNLDDKQVMFFYLTCF